MSWQQYVAGLTIRGPPQLPATVENHSPQPKRRGRAVQQSQLQTPPRLQTSYPQQPQQTQWSPFGQPPPIWHDNQTFPSQQSPQAQSSPFEQGNQVYIGLHPFTPQAQVQSQLQPHPQQSSNQPIKPRSTPRLAPYVTLPPLSIPPYLQIISPLPFIQNCPFTLVIPKQPKPSHLTTVINKRMHLIDARHTHNLTLMLAISSTQNFTPHHHALRRKTFLTSEIINLHTYLSDTMGSNLGIDINQIIELGDFTQGTYTIYYLAMMYSYMPADGIGTNGQQIDDGLRAIVTKGIELAATGEVIALLERMRKLLLDDLMHMRQRIGLAGLPQGLTAVPTISDVPVRNQGNDVSAGALGINPFTSPGVEHDNTLTVGYGGSDQASRDMQVQQWLQRAQAGEWDVNS